GDPETRVVARRHRSKAEWLVTAWAAGGEDRDVTAAIPGLGSVTLHARVCGSVYRASRTEDETHLERIDEDGMLPTSRL
ncbi:MAG: hypothetical protein ACYTG0_32780, partial [Planctomycetota bacterium]